MIAILEQMLRTHQQFQTKNRKVKMKNKKGMSTWIWILIILILIGAGIGLYFLLTGNISLGGNSIPRPPALPSG